MTSVAKEYGTALFQLAQEADAAATVAQGLATVTAAFAETPGYPVMLSSPAIPKEERRTALAAAFGGRVAPMVVHFLQLLCENGRLDCFAECAAVFEALYRDSRRVQQAAVTSPVPLTADQQAKLVAVLEQKTGRRIQLSCTVDPSLLGGAVVELEGKRYDGSMKRRLQVIKEGISELA